MEYQQGYGGLEVVLAIAAALFAAVVAWKSFDYVLAERRRRRENPPPPGDHPDAGP